MTEGPTNPEIDALEQKIERVREALEKDMKQQETEIKAEISNLRTGVEKDIDY